MSTIFKNDDYEIIKIGNVYRLSYFNERCKYGNHITCEKTKSKVTKNFEFIKKYIR